MIVPNVLAQYGLPLAPLPLIILPGEGLPEYADVK